MFAAILALALIAGAPQDITPPEPPKARTQLPIGSDQLVVRFVDDRGVSIGARTAWVSQCWSGPGWGRSEGARNAPRALDADGVLRIPAQRSWSGELSVNLYGSGLFGHAHHGEAIELDWDGTPGERTVTIARLAAIEGRVVSGAPLDGVDVSISEATFDWYRPTDATQNVASTGPAPTSRGLEVQGNGSFRIDGLTPGTFELTLARGTARQTETVTVGPGEVLRGVQFDLSGGPWITGRALGFDGAPLAGATLHASRATGFGAVFLALEVGASLWSGVDAEGRFRLGAGYEGLYRIELEAPAPKGVEAWRSPPRPTLVSRLVWCPANGDVAVDLVAPGPPLIVRGRLRAVDVELEDMCVRLESTRDGSHRFGRIQADGEFEIDVPGTGTYDLVFFTKSDGARRVGPFRHSIDLQSSVSGLEVKAPRSGIDIVGSPETRAWSLRLKGSDRDSPVHKLSPGRGDACRVDALPHGDYTLVDG